MSEIFTLIPALVVFFLSSWCKALAQSWSQGILAMSVLRMSFLADPNSAATEFCGTPQTRGCILSTWILTDSPDATLGWNDMCQTDLTAAWGLPRHLRMGMRCQSTIGFATVAFDGPLIELLTGY